VPAAIDPDDATTFDVKVLPETTMLGAAVKLPSAEVKVYEPRLLRVSVLSAMAVPCGIKVKNGVA
jgi:hypothetical protein